MWGASTSQRRVRSPRPTAASPMLSVRFCKCSPAFVIFLPPSNSSGTWEREGGTKGQGAVRWQRKKGNETDAEVLWDRWGQGQGAQPHGETWEPGGAGLGTGAADGSEEHPSQVPWGRLGHGSAPRALRGLCGVRFASVLPPSSPGTAKSFTRDTGSAGQMGAVSGRESSSAQTGRPGSECSALSTRYQEPQAPGRTPDAPSKKQEGGFAQTYSSPVLWFSPTELGLRSDPGVFEFLHH